MDLTYPEELVAIGDSLVRFIDREVVSLEQSNAQLLKSERHIYDATGRYVPKVLELRRQVRMRSAELGFYNLFGDPALGGEGLGAVAATYLQELLNHRYGPERLLIQTVVLPSPFTNGLTPVLTHLATEVFERFGHDIRNGSKTLCFALSEPDAGSDVFSLKTRAVREGDEWIINGSKQWITNSPYADFALVFAITHDELFRHRQGGVTGFFVPTDTPGFSVPGIIPVMGHLGGETGIVALDGVRIPDEYRLGAVDSGLQVALHGVNTGRLSMAGTCVGLARWALDQAVEYAKVRKTFGKPIGEHQAVQFLLADSAIDIYAVKSMMQNLAWRIDQGQPSIKELSMVKAAATEMLGRVMDRCMEVHGGMGLTNELRLEAGFRYARLLRIPDGTAEIQRRSIAQQMLRGDTSL